MIPHQNRRAVWADPPDGWPYVRHYAQIKALDFVALDVREPLDEAALQQVGDLAKQLADALVAAGVTFRRLQIGPLGNLMPDLVRERSPRGG